MGECDSIVACVPLDFQEASTQFSKNVHTIMPVSCINTQARYASCHDQRKNTELDAPGAYAFSVVLHPLQCVVYCNAVFFRD